MNKSTLSKYICEIGTKLRQGRVQMIEMEQLQQSQLASFRKKLHPRLSEAPNQQEIPYTHTFQEMKKVPLPAMLRMRTPAPGRLGI